MSTWVLNVNYIFSMKHISVSVSMFYIDPVDYFIMYVSVFTYYNVNTMLYLQKEWREGTKALDHLASNSTEKKSWESVRVSGCALAIPTSIRGTYGLLCSNRFSIDMFVNRVFPRLHIGCFNSNLSIKFLFGSTDSQLRNWKFVKMFLPIRQTTAYSHWTHSSIWFGIWCILSFFGG